MLLANTLPAEPVAVQAGTRGQGMTFRHGGGCYLVLPAHVGEEGQRAQVVAEGGASGPATLREPFWEGIDLAVGTVRGAAAETCTTPSEALTGPPPAVAVSGRGDLPFITDEGLVRLLPMTITETRYLEFDAVFAEPSVTVQQGLSGGFLMRDGQPLGMVLREGDAAGTVTFMRMEEIAMNLGRWLGHRGAEAGLAAESLPAAPGAADGLPLMVIESSQPAVGPEAMAEGMVAGTSPFLYEPQGPLVLTLSLAVEGAATLSRVLIRSAPTEGAALPRRITVLSSPDAAGGNWDDFHRGEMGLDGIFDTGAKRPRFARRLQVIVSSAWDEGPVRLDEIRAE